MLLTQTAHAGGWLATWNFRDSTPDNQGWATTDSTARAVDQDGAALFDGILYNGADLRAALGPGAAPADRPAALVLAAYRRWGVQFLGKVRGVFAVVIWDELAGTLLAARDPLGVYPLFYAEAGPGLLFSPSIDTLLAHPRVSPEVNRPALVDHLCRRWTRPTETYYAAVRRVPPGHYLRAQQGRIESTRYWQVLPDGPVAWVTEAEIDQFDVLLDQAVARARAAQPAGLWLSGGLDSVTVAAVARDQSDRTGQSRPLALSLVLPDAECNEEAIQRQVAAELGLPQQLVGVAAALGGGALLPAALQVNAEWPVPLSNTFLPAFGDLALRARQAGCRVILTGGGGDETLGVGPMYAADLLRRGDLLGLYRLSTTTLRSYQRARTAQLRYLLWTEGARRILKAQSAWAFRRTLPGVYESRRRRLIAGQTPPWLAPDPQLRREVDERVLAFNQADVTNQFYLHAARTELDNPYTGMEMEELFTFGRRMQIAVRQPFWDPDLLAFLYRTPPDLLNRGGRSKGLVREKLVRRFPTLGFERQRKVDATGFFRRTVIEQGRPAWQALGGARNLAHLGVVDPAGLDSVLEPILSGAQPAGAHRFWDVIRLEGWLDSHVA